MNFIWLATAAYLSLLAWRYVSLRLPTTVVGWRRLFDLPSSTAHTLDRGTQSTVEGGDLKSMYAIPLFAIVSLFIQTISHALLTFLSL